MINRIIISVIASALVLTLFPLLFLGIYSIISTGNIADKDTTSMFLTFGTGILYAATVLVCAFQAVRNVTKPVKAYLFLLIPVVILGSALTFLKLQ